MQVEMRLWSSNIQGDYGHWSAILNADNDPFAEVAMVGSGRLAIYNHDGTIIENVIAGTNQPGPPCVADFDGDEEPEIAWASSSVFNMFELDGSIRWSASINDFLDWHHALAMTSMVMVHTRCFCRSKPVLYLRWRTRKCFVLTIWTLFWNHFWFSHCRRYGQ